ncbi:MAG TPA: pyridoxamine 5'-phosphate oxidase family protein [Anaerolineales bacterium]|nr:pyridoxamine 5'-phosphate oxidase family protein [Anaerolineales bacterium]
MTSPSSPGELPIDDLLVLSTLTLATCGLDGEPHAAPVYFAARLPVLVGKSPQLYFFSDPDSQHCLDVSANPRAAAACYPECQGWQDIRGLQMRGQVRLIEYGTEWEHAWACYTAKFPFVKTLRAIVARNALYVFVPHWIRLVDNRRGFGFKQEWLFS